MVDVAGWEAEDEGVLLPRCRREGTTEGTTKGFTRGATSVDEIQEGGVGTELTIWGPDTGLVLPGINEIGLRKEAAAPSSSLED